MVDRLHQIDGIEMNAPLRPKEYSSHDPHLLFVSLANEGLSFYVAAGSTVQ
jgi:hypothetical protein